MLPGLRITAHSGSSSKLRSVGNGVAVITVTASGPRIGAAEELFGGRFAELGAISWAIAPDGERLLVAVPLENETTPTLELVANWVEGLD